MHLHGKNKSSRSTQLIRPNFCHLYVLSLNLNFVFLGDPGETNRGTIIMAYTGEAPPENNNLFKTAEWCIKIRDAGSHITRLPIRKVKRP